MQVNLFILRKYMHVVFVVYRIGKVIGIVQFWQSSLFAEFFGLVLVVPNLANSYE